MDDKGKKPALAIMLALGKKKPSAGGDASGDDGSAPSPECVECVRHFFEAGSDGDYEGAAKALSSAMDHIEGSEGEEGEEEEPSKEY